MKQNSKYSMIFLSATLGAGFTGHAEAADWRMLTAQYNTTASKMVTKDFGSLTVQTVATCADSYSDAESKLDASLQNLVASIKKYPAMIINNAKPDIQVSTENRYVISQNADKKIYDRCAQDKVIDPAAAGIDLTATMFTATATLSVETKEKLSQLTELRQKISLYAEDFNKENPNEKINVNKEVFALSEVAKYQVEGELDSQTSLLGPTQSRLSVDQRISGGFKEAYTTEASPGYSLYKTISPTIDAEGRSVVKAYYVFNVKFLPKNFTGFSGTAPDDLIGTRQMVAEGTMITDTDFYIGRVNLVTSCHPSKVAANAAMLPVFNDFKNQAESEVIDTKNEANPERVEISVSEPREANTWMAWELSPQDTNPNGGFGRNDRKVISYINQCSGEVVATEDSQSLPKTYQSVQSITVITKNFKGLKALEASAAKYNEGKKGATRVKTSALAASPRLNPRKHFEAVEILAYKNALENFLSPQGALAKFLLDEVKSSEAYYTLEGYSMYNDSNVSGGNKSNRGLESAPSFGAGGGRSDASEDSLDEYSVVASQDENIPQAELTRNMVYTVSYKPNKDLIRVLSERRKAATLTPAPTRR